MIGPSYEGALPDCCCWVPLLPFVDVLPVPAVEVSMVVLRETLLRRLPPKRLAKVSPAKEERRALLREGLMRSEEDDAELVLSVEEDMVDCVEAIAVLARSTSAVYPLRRARLECSLGL